MARHRLGARDLAQKTMARLRQIMKQPFLYGRPVAKTGGREAEAVLGLLSLGPQTVEIDAPIQDDRANAC